MMRSCAATHMALLLLASLANATLPSNETSPSNRTLPLRPHSSGIDPWPDIQRSTWLFQRPDAFLSLQTAAERNQTAVRVEPQHMVVADGMLIAGFPECHQDGDIIDGVWWPSSRCMLVVGTLNHTCTTGKRPTCYPISQWGGQVWLTKDGGVTLHELLPPCSSASISRSVPCPELQLRRHAHTLTVHTRSGPDIDPANARMWKATCVIGGLMRADNILHMVSTASVVCSFDGVHWFTHADLPVPVFGHAAVSYRGLIYVIGGQQDTIDGSAVFESIVGDIIRPSYCNISVDTEACQPWRLLGWRKVLDQTPLGHRVRMFASVSYAAGRPDGYVPTDRDDVQLVVAGGWTDLAQGTGVSDLWVINDVADLTTWRRVTTLLPTIDLADPQSTSIAAVDWCYGGYTLFDVSGNYSAISQLGLIPAGSKPFGSSAMLLIAGRNPYLSLNGGLSWITLTSFITYKYFFDPDRSNGLLTSRPWSGATALPVLYDSRRAMTVLGRGEGRAYAPLQLYFRVCADCGVGESMDRCGSSPDVSSCVLCDACSPGKWRDITACKSTFASNLPSVPEPPPCQQCSSCLEPFAVLRPCNGTSNTLCASMPSVFAPPILRLTEAYSLMGTISVSLIWLLYFGAVFVCAALCKPRKALVYVSGQAAPLPYGAVAGRKGAASWLHLPAARQAAAIMLPYAITAAQWFAMMSMMGSLVRTEAHTSTASIIDRLMLFGQPPATLCSGKSAPAISSTFLRYSVSFAMVALWCQLAAGTLWLLLCSMQYRLAAKQTQLRANGAGHAHLSRAPAVAMLGSLLHARTLDGLHGLVEESWKSHDAPADQLVYWFRLATVIRLARISSFVLFDVPCAALTGGWLGACMSCAGGNFALLSSAGMAFAACLCGLVQNAIAIRRSAASKLQQRLRHVARPGASVPDWDSAAVNVPRLAQNPLVNALRLVQAADAAKPVSDIDRAAAPAATAIGGAQQQ